MDNERGPMDEIFFIGIPRDANAGLPPLVLMRFYIPRVSNVPQRLNEYIFTYIRPVRAEPTLELIWPPPRPPPGPQGGVPQQGFHPQQGEHRERERERERDRERENSRRDPEQEQERNRERQCKEEREESSHCSSVFP